MESRFDRFTSAVSSINQSIIRIKKAEMRKYGLRSGHVDILHFLFENPNGLTSKELSALCDLDKAAISRYMMQMEEAGFAYANEFDDMVYKRKWLLSDKGMETARYVDMRIDQAVEAVGAGVSEEERTVLYRVLEQIDASLKMHVNETDR